MGNGYMPLTWTYFVSDKKEVVRFATYFPWTYFDHVSWTQKMRILAEEKKLIFGESLIYKPEN